MLIPEGKIDEIRARVDFVAIVQRHGVDLKKAGRSLKGCCPFHGEKTASFHVYPDDKHYHCFGCHAHGDVFTFVQRLMGKTFMDVVQDLAKEVGVDLEAGIDPAMKERAQLKQATDFAAEHFKQRLWDPIAGHTAREYLRSRGVTDDVARQFGLGWAPNVWSDLSERLREHGFLGFAEKAGLVAQRNSGDGFYDMFRGRLIIPIRSPEGRTIAFGGRLLEGDNGPKYLNSRESRLYNKSETLYGMDVAREEIRKKKSVVLTEGYFDCIGMHQAGVKNAVALCSTALTAGHMAALARAEAKELVLLLDGDNAGRAAVERLAGPILAAGAQARVASLPDGEDPDTFARKVGPEGVQKLVSEAQPLTAWLFATVLPQGAGSSFEEKMGAVQRMKPIAGTLPVGLARSAFFAAMAKHFGLPAAELELELRGKQAQPVLKPVPKPIALHEKPPTPIERDFAAAVMHNRYLLQKDTSGRAQELKHTGLRSLVAAIASGTPVEDALYEASDRLKSELASVQLPPDDAELEAGFLRACQLLEISALEDRQQSVMRELSQLPNVSDLSDEAKEKMEQAGRIRERLQALKAALKKTG